MYTRPKGRFVIIDSSIDGCKVTLCNVYGPNDDNLDFYADMIHLIESIPNYNRIVGGDFNLVLDIEKDKKGELKIQIKNHKY